MAVSNFKANFSNKLLDKLEVEMRNRVETQVGQLLIIPGPKELKKAIDDTFNNQVEISDYHLAAAVKKAREHAKKLDNLFSKNNPLRAATVENVIRDGRMGLPSSFILGENMFVVTSFTSSIDAVKKTMLTYFTSKGLLTDDQRKELSKNVHKGHGMKGAAVSQVEISNAMTSIPLEYKDELRESFGAFAKKAKIPKNVRVEVDKLFVVHDQIVSPKGELKDDYVSSVAFQLGKENIGKDAAFEKSVKKAFKDFADDYAKNLVNEQGSSTLKQKITKVTLDKFDDKKFIKVTSKDKNVSLKTKHKTANKGKKQKVGNARVSQGGKTPTKVRFRAGASSAPLAMIQSFNAKLPSKIAENMKSPALNYRTGRFASSVRVVDAVLTPQGFPSFGYTYMKYPYQTFEPGYAQGSVERDPRKLIDRTMREIAVEFAIGRFYTRRL
jgi:hypothetical protein